MGLCRKAKPLYLPAVMLPSFRAAGACAGGWTQELRVHARGGQQGGAAAVARTGGSGLAPAPSNRLVHLFRMIGRPQRVHRNALSVSPNAALTASGCPRLPAAHVSAKITVVYEWAIGGYFCSGFRKQSALLSMRALAGGRCRVPQGSNTA